MMGVRLLAISAAAALVAASQPSFAAEARVEAELRGANVVPPVETAGVGSVEAILNTETGEIIWFIDYRGLSGPVIAIRLHGPAAEGENAEALLTPTGAVARPILGGTSVSDALAEHFMAGLLYLVLTTAAHPEGELRAQLVVVEMDEGAGGED